MNESKAGHVAPREMTNDEINRTLHEFMGKCDHEYTGLYKSGTGWAVCRKCEDTFDPCSGVPDYTSDDSPRRLLNEVVAKIVGNDSAASDLLYDLLWKAAEDDKTDGHQLMLTAEQIARACYEAIKDRT